MKHPPVCPKGLGVFKGGNEPFSAGGYVLVAFGASGAL